ncbi:MAG: hypothetical protein PF508_17235 [Spirochaeta sp.]|jgi:hypothetical protein|nr:hypothetical protein [Spirochaeta sp.]
MCGAVYAQLVLQTIQVNSLSREWNVGKEKLYSLLHAMEQAGGELCGA